MKELSIEEKAKANDGNYKAYTELISRLEDVKDAIKKQNYGIAMDVLCKPYPQFQVITHSELKESEDERIRKALLESFNYTNPWDFLNNKGITKGSIVAWLEKQGEQNLANSCKTCKDEQKSEEEVDNLHDYLYGEQKPVWSEDDEKMIRALLSMCDVYSTKFSFYPKENKDIERLKSWLKHLKERYTWKPSEKQKEALLWCVVHLGGADKQTLGELLEELNKL